MQDYFKTKFFTQVRMPIVRIATTLARNQLPAMFIKDFAHHMAPVLNKSVDKMTCILETDKEMSFKVSS